MSPSTLSLKAVAVALSLFPAATLASLYDIRDASPAASAPNVVILEVPSGTLYVPTCNFVSSSTSSSLSSSATGAFGNSTLTSTSSYPLLYTPSPTTTYGNSSAAYGYNATAHGGGGYGNNGGYGQMTTSTVYATTTETFTSCAPGTSVCPASTITSTYALYTTVSLVSGDSFPSFEGGLTSTLGLIPAEPSSGSGPEGTGEGSSSTTTAAGNGVAAGTGSVLPTAAHVTGDAPKTLGGSGVAAIVGIVYCLFFL